MFIGSSSEAKTIAYALQENLEGDADVTVWDQDLFRSSRYIVESLEAVLHTFDYALFVLSGDDVTTIRGTSQDSVRDNVLFECGLFIGRLGRERCLFLIARSDSLHLPSDLAGLQPLTYESTRTDNLNAALGPACNKIRNILDASHMPTTHKQQYDLVTNRFPSQISHRYQDLACVFTSRSSFEDAIGYHQLFAGAHSIRALGISLNAITIHWGLAHLKDLASSGCKIELLFLDPLSADSALREALEHLPLGSLAQLTTINLALINRVRKQLPNPHILNVRTYRDTPLVNLYIINEAIMVVQHYFPDIRGQEGPVMVIKQTTDVKYGLFSLYATFFERLWSGAIDVGL